MRVTILIMCLAAWLVEPAIAQVRPWPFWTTRHTYLCPTMLAGYREKLVLAHMHHEAYYGCRGHRKGSGYWGWKAKRSKLVLTDRHGKRLLPHRYDKVIVTADTLIMGVQFAPSKKTAVECFDSRGNVATAPSNGPPTNPQRIRVTLWRDPKLDSFSTHD